MIELLTLGVVDLRALGRDTSAVVRQPKRLAFLSYLAADSPRRFHRRDTLLALFWPELDEEHARAALRRSLHFVRQALGAEVLAGRGDEEIGVPGDALWCDATELERALESGDAARAVSLYRGEFLAGLHVEGGSSEFHEWLDRRRERLRREAAGAAASLADRAAREGRDPEAAAWARRALELLPDDEPALRRLLVLLDRSGDRSGALQAYAEFARRLAVDLDLEPSRELRSLVESIRARAGPDAAAAAATIAVLPFTVRGDPRFAYLAEGMVDLLATKLDGAGAIRAVDPRALLHFLARSGLGPDDAAGAAGGRAVAAHFGAGHYLLGSILEAAGRLEVTASLYRRDGEIEASARAHAASEVDLFDLVDEIVRQLLASQKVAPGTRLGRIAALTTGSLEALRAYLRGERELRAGRYFDALEGFQTAAEADPSFALAHYRAASAAAGCALHELARELAGRAYEHRARLSPHDHLVLRAQRAWLDGATAEAESLYTATTGTYPDDVDVWFHLGDLLFHSNPMRGRSAAEARAPFQRVLALEPDHLAATVHLARIAAIEGRRDEMLERIGRVLHAGPDADQALALRALRAYAVGDGPGIETVNAELRSARAITVASAFADVALYSGNLPGAAKLAREFLEVARSPELRALCHVQLANLALAQGDPGTAGEELQRAQALDHAWGLEARGLLATLPVASTESTGPGTSFGDLGPSVGDLDALRRELTAWNAAAVPPSSFAIFAMHNGLHATIREYLLGLVALRLDDRAAARAHAAALGQVVPRDGGLGDCLASELDAALARAEGRTAEALAILDQTRPRLWFQLTVASPFFCLTSRRFLQAELLRETGRREEAAAWYGSLAQRSPYELVYRHLAMERLVQLGPEPHHR